MKNSEQESPVFLDYGFLIHTPLRGKGYIYIDMAGISGTSPIEQSPIRDQEGIKTRLSSNFGNEQSYSENIEKTELLLLGDSECHVYFSTWFSALIDESNRTGICIGCYISMENTGSSLELLSDLKEKCFSWIKNQRDEQIKLRNLDENIDNIQALSSRHEGQAIDMFQDQIIKLNPRREEFGRQTNKENLVASKIIDSPKFQQALTKSVQTEIDFLISTNDRGALQKMLGKIFGKNS